ncbi:PfkB family carbohydrate kinase [Buttiauxella sp. A2-C2_NF]|uniref:PfkB family carbohydrate kinase n=1 Tax=Buttiauxella ferragutiae TaxID=82989 RepID=UPI0022B7DF10|nr:PfkB family carbohydrate kinase [Buttiauxella ferragutiae]MCE0826787.1 PfkB family carbohydrate kinase [Buttiauxella ferragutiae]
MFITYKIQRHKFIMSLILKEKNVQVSSLARYLGVTDRTIRRDLQELESIGRIKCFHGGAELVVNAEHEMYKKGNISLHRDMTLGLISSNIKGILMSELSNECNGKVFVLGSFNTDLVYRVDDFVKSGQTIQATKSYCLPGGKGSNQAVASVMAQAKTHFAVKLGDDEFAKKAIQFLKGIMFEQIINFEADNCPTGSAVVMVSENEGDNAIIIYPGANQMFSEQDIISCYGFISESDVFLTQMENNTSAISQALRFAHASDITTILNPAPWRADVSDLLQWVDILTPNLTEAESIIGGVISTKDDIKNAAENIYNKGVKNVIITLGKEGCWYFNGVNHRHFSAFSAVNIDTSGAGDAFNGAFAARVAKGDDIETAIIYANAFASLAVEREGAANMPPHDAVNKRLHTQ